MTFRSVLFAPISLSRLARSCPITFTSLAVAQVRTEVATRCFLIAPRRHFTQRSSSWSSWISRVQESVIPSLYPLSTLPQFLWASWPLYILYLISQSIICQNQETSLFYLNPLVFNTIAHLVCVAREYTYIRSESAPLPASPGPCHTRTIRVTYYGTGTPPQSAVTKCHIRPAMPKVNDACRCWFDVSSRVWCHQSSSKYLRLRRGIQKKGDEWWHWTQWRNSFNNANFATKLRKCL